MTSDLTEGSIHRKLWSFSIPMLISVMFQQIYNIADSMIAGKYAGENALAAVGASYPVTMLFIAVAFGCNIGCSVTISQFFGARDYQNMKTAVFTGFFSCLILSLILTGTGLLFWKPLMKLMQTPDNIFDAAGIFLKIYTAGIPFLFLYNVCAGIFNALGDSRTPLFLLIISSISNIILDLLFVCCFHLSVSGVAWATFIAQGFSCIASIIILFNRISIFSTPENSIYFSAAMLKRISIIAIPSILQQSFVSVGNVFIQGLINSYGSAVIAGYSAAIRLNTFAVTAFSTLADGLSGFTAQNIGAKKTERIKKGFLSGMLLAAFTFLPFCIIYFFFGRNLLLLFMHSESSRALQTGKEFLIITAPFYPVISIKLMADAVLRGAGCMGWFMTTTFTDLLLRVILAFILSPFYNTTGIWISWPIGWTIATILSFSFYLKGIWKNQSSLRRFKNPED